MRSFAATTAIAVIVSSLFTRNTQASVISNGSFEQNAYFIERSLFPRLDDVNGSAPTGWLRDPATLAEYVTRAPLYSGVTLYNPADGDYFVAMHGGEWWEQTFATIPGTTYDLTYSVAYGAVWYEGLVPPGYYRPGSTPGAVTLTGNLVLFTAGFAGTAAAPTGTTPLDSPFVWSQHTATFTADSNSTVLRFARPTSPDDGYIFVDNASVTPIPEPTSAALVIAAFGLVSRRR
jgi:hypothetical protein